MGTLGAVTHTNFFAQALVWGTVVPSWGIVASSIYFGISLTVKYTFLAQ